MSNSFLDGRPRNERRFLLRQEERARANGEWGEWEHMPLPTGIPEGVGWGRDVRAVYRNKVFAVLERPVGNVVHLAISSISGVRPTWLEGQRIKNELAGEDATAVEVYPPSKEVIDEADMYHLWVLPDALPFSIYDDRRA